MKFSLGLTLAGISIVTVSGSIRRKMTGTSTFLSGIATGFFCIAIFLALVVDIYWGYRL